MNGKDITNLKDPQSSDSSYAASVNYVNTTIDRKIRESEERSIEAVQRENVSKKLW